MSGPEPERAASGVSPDVGDADVVVLGEAMRLLVASPGTALNRATVFGASIAGAETNVAVGLARLGLRARWLGRVGADAAGDAVLRELRAEGVDVSAVEIDPVRPTGLLLRDSHPARSINVEYRRTGSAASAMSARFVRARGLSGARLVHVTGITAMLSNAAHAAVLSLLEMAREQGATVSFDPNIRYRLASGLRWRTVVGPLLDRADLVFAGDDELQVLGQETDSLLDRGVGTVVVKHADKSASVTTAQGTWRQPTLARSVVDVVGAGDALVAGYLGAWLRGRDPREALHAGAVSAALVVGEVTDIGGLPTAAELGRDEVDR
ncbi:sugar kinase [Streptomyces sp. NPDC020917]|uniref:sugar kinase n=1 Tax=Streptomyces sp. NPDC020917 TaxID=3365102 RepID=UPI00378E9629